MKWFDKTADGLTEDELRAVEEAFGFTFPADMRDLLAQALPTGDGWPDWRQPHAHDLIEWFDTPAAAIEEMVDDGFWRETWGERPKDDDDAVEEARRLVSLAPILIPVFANVFLPSRPCKRGNPLFAFDEDGIVIAASDLEAFARGERGGNAPRKIDFWSELARPE